MGKKYNQYNDDNRVERERTIIVVVVVIKGP